MQMQSLSYPESPNFDAMHSHHLHSQNNQFNQHNLYSSPNIQEHHYQSLSNVPSEHDLRNKVQRQQQQQQLKSDTLNNMYQSEYNAYANNSRPRQQANRVSITATTPYFATSNGDNFPGSSTSSTTPRSGYEYGASTNPKPYSDYYGSPTILQQPGLSNNKAQQTSFSSQFSSGPHISSQTPYGPHVVTGPSAGSSHVNGGPSSAALNGPAGLAHNSTTSNANNNANEEISTIFVVGFPDDMQEREFQNMFTFSPDFEAATLKIPNKESTAYNAVNNVNSARPPFATFAGSNDPYNLVTVNQGGVIVDAGRDGTITSWPMHGDDVTGVNFNSGNNVPPRKQIIGFAKFRTREAALAARDGLQGRRVDIEKGAVLKAEMAKKNLHTKRGVGPVAGPANAPSNLTMQQSILNGANAQSFGMGGNDMIGMREREMGTLGAMGLNGRLAQWRDQIQHPQESSFPSMAEERRVGLTNGMNHTAASLLSNNLRGARERAEEEERKADMLRQRSSMSAYDAFHSVPAVDLSKYSNPNSMFSPPGDDGTPNGGSPMLSNSQVFGRAHMHQDEPGPWDNIPTRASHPHSPSQRSESPANAPIHYSDIPPRPISPSEGAPAMNARGIPNRISHSMSESSSSNASAAHGLAHLNTERAALNGAPGVGELSNALTGLDMDSDGGKTSPQLPSPASGSSSKSNGDQNPPINTLYVGNLPTAFTPGGFPQDGLEESLKELFALQPGYRRLSFRQKNNGPMCFVEFDDVQFATRALNELYGNNLKGLVKGGIRLSYSKNPLGVRTPTSATGSTVPMQQQQQHVPSQSNGPPPQSFIPSYATEFRSRLSDDVHSGLTMPRDTMIPSSHPPFHGYPQDQLASSPPPRFSSPPSFVPSTGPSSLASGIPRYGLGGGISGGFSSSFSPFGLSNSPPPQIPDHSSEGHLISHSPHIPQ